MSVGIFVFAILLAAVVATLGVIIDDCGFNGKTVLFPFMLCGLSLALVFVALSFSYPSFRVMRYSMKYDHVVELTWKPKVCEAPQNLDWSKVIYHDVYQGVGSCECEQVIMAWNDDNHQDKYDVLVSKGSAE